MEKLLEKAVRAGTTFSTKNYTKTLHELWGMGISSLGQLHVFYATKLKELTEADKLSIVKDPELKRIIERQTTSFRIIEYVIETLQKEKKEEAERLKAIKHNEEIDKLIKEKKDKELKAKSIKELENSKI